MNRSVFPLLTAVALLAAGCQNVNIPSAATGSSRMVGQASAAANPFRLNAHSLKLNGGAKISISAEMLNGKSIRLVDPSKSYGAIAWVDGKAVSTTSKTETRQVLAAFDEAMKQLWRAYLADPSSVKEKEALIALVSAFTTLQWDVEPSQATATPYQLQPQSLKLAASGKTAISAKTLNGQAITLVDPARSYGAIAWVDGKAVEVGSPEAKQLLAAFDATLKQRWNASLADPSSVKDKEALTALVNAFTLLRWSVEVTLK